MSHSAARQLRRSLGISGLLMVATLVPFAGSSTQADAVDTSCWGQAQVPQYNPYPKWAEAAGYLPCGGSYTLKLMTSTGVALATQSGIAGTPQQVYTNWTNCPTGTTVYTYLTSHSYGSYVSWGGTETSASIVCG